jgi:AcrR family transcriptional regulator
MRLWTERGFETGIEDTTIDEIVAAAGVTKGTFSFHFAHKEEILLELGYQTATLLSEEAARCIKAKRSIEDSLRKVTNTLATSVKAAPFGRGNRSGRADGDGPNHPGSLHGLPDGMVPGPAESPQPGPATTNLDRARRAAARRSLSCTRQALRR